MALAFLLSATSRFNSDGNPVFGLVGGRYGVDRSAACLSDRVNLAVASCRSSVVLNFQLFVSWLLTSCL